MNSWLTWILALFGVALLGVIGYSFRPQPEEVDLAPAERGTLRVTVDEDGKTRIREKYVVSTPLSGRLLRINMDPGDPVVAGETVLAMLEPRDPELLDARAVAQAEARVRAARAALLKTGPVLEQARIEQANAESNLARIRDARRGGAYTAADVEDALARYLAASEELRSAKYAEEIAEFELQQAEAALLHSRPRVEDGATAPATGQASENPNNGWNFIIRSPITGRVLRVLQESSGVVTAGTELLELGDPTDLEVVVDVLSSDAVKINPGAQVLLEHWGGDEPLNGRVRLVEPSGFTKISTLGVEEQRVNVIVDLVDPLSMRRSLGDGFRVEARIVVSEAEDALIIPASALFRASGDWAVFKVVGGRAVETRVDVGRQNGLEAEILAGLDESDQVVLYPSDQITDGTRVAVR